MCWKYDKNITLSKHKILYTNTKSVDILVTIPWNCKVITDDCARNLEWNLWKL